MNANSLNPKNRPVGLFFGLVFLMAAVFVTVNLILQLLLEVEKAEEAFGVEV